MVGAFIAHAAAPVALFVLTGIIACL